MLLWCCVCVFPPQSLCTRNDNRYLDVFVALVFIIGTLLMNCSMQSFAYKLSSPLKRLAIEMQKVSEFVSE